MPIVPLPLKPSKGQPWLSVGDAWSMQVVAGKPHDTGNQGAILAAQLDIHLP